MITDVHISGVIFQVGCFLTGHSLILECIIPDHLISVS